MQAKITARDLLNVGSSLLFSMLPKKFTLVFDDGELVTTRRRTLVSHYFWEYHRQYPETPLLVRHHIQPLIQQKPFNSGSHTDLCGIIERDVYRIYEEVDENIVAKTSKIAFDCVNRMTNEMMPSMAPYVAPFDLLDAIEINRHPRIQEAFRNSSPTGKSVQEVYDIVKDVIMNDSSLDHNGLARAYRNNTVKREQVLQTVAFRGIPTEPDGRLYRLAIQTGYLEGMSKIYDFLTDSRSAPKALMSAEAPLQDSEYLARRLQFLVSVVHSIVGKDCGSTEYVNWYVDPEIQEDNKVISVGGIKAMQGKFILDEETNQLKELKGNEAHLNGKYVRMRSVLTCKNHDPHTVCRTCFGGLWRNVYNHQNLGHLCCVTITERITQNTLGTKHLVATGEGARIQLTPVSSKFFKVGTSKVDYLLLPYLKKFQTKLVIPRTETMNLADLMKMESTENLMLPHISYLTSVVIVQRDKGVAIPTEVNVNQGHNKAFMSLQLIKYIRKHGFTVDKDNNFEIDLKEWNYDKTIFTVPQTEVSYSEHGQNIGRVIESNMAAIDERQKPESAVNTLQELNTLCAEKLSVPLSALEVIIYASMSWSKDNAYMARGSSESVLGIARQLIYRRSLSAAYAFQGHADFMLDGRSFFAGGRVNSALDVFFDPASVIADQSRIGRF